MIDIRSILYMPCRELPSPIRLGNCQGRLASSTCKRPHAKWRANNCFATRRVANSINAARKASPEESSEVGDATHLRHPRMFYLAFPICDALRRKLSWMNYRSLFADLDLAATVKESLSVQTEGESKVSEHFRDPTNMLRPRKKRRHHNDGR